MKDLATYDLLPRFLRFFEEKKVNRSASFLVAVSGGVDSVVLCDLCQRAGFSFVMAHCNFHLRGDESDRDENFVRSLGKQFSVEVLVRSFPDTEKYAEEKKMSIQEAARELRYDWFRILKKESGFSSVLLAHHADDNIETLLMNFFRGTGLQGMTGMPSASESLLRPLLSVRRGEIMEYARERKLKWVEDSSNAATKYTRNFLRHELIPAIKRVYPEAEEILLDNIHRFETINQFYRAVVREQIEKLVERNGVEVRIPIRKLRQFHYRLLIYEIIREFGFGEKAVGEVVKLMDSSSGKFIEKGNYQIVRHGAWLIIAPRGSERSVIPVEEDEKQLSFEGGSLQLEKADASSFKMLKDENLAQLDAKEIRFPLILRRWKQGDYFYPLGMRKKKKLARFFIDIKLAKHQKENVWVLESDKKIIWVVGHRIDDRFKITPATKEMLILRFSAAQKTL